MNQIVLGTVEKIESRKDKTVKMIFGTQEMTPTDAGNLFQFNDKLIKLLLCSTDISEDMKEAVSQTPLTAKREGLKQSQKIRLLIADIHKQRGLDIASEEYYRQRTNQIIMDLENELYELKEK